MKIKVKQTHIKRGRQFRCKECPVVLAVQESFPFTPPGNISVGGCIRIGSCFIPCPDAVDDFIARFDNGQEVGPFEFELDI